MKSPLHLGRRVQGMVIVFALLVVLVGTIVLAAWVQVLATRAMSAESALQAQQRRIAVGNGRALARQFVLEQAPSGALSVSNASATISGGWGGFTIVGAPSGFWSQTNVVAGNPFSPMGGLSFVASFTGSITSGGASEPWTFRVRTRSPFSAVFPLVIHNNADTNTLNAEVRRINWTNLVGITNVPSVPMTWGVNTTNSYAGYFSGALQTNVAGFAATTNFVGYTNASATNIELTISSPISPALIYFVATNVVSSSAQRFTNNAGTPVYTNNTHTITALRIVGSTGTNLLQVIVPASNTDFTRITLEGTNSRPTTIYRIGRPLTLTNTTANAQWSACLTLSNAPLTVNALNTLTIAGLRTDTNVSVTGTLNFNPGLNADMVEFYSERLMWLEENRTP